jgi:hypothetical protein
MVENEIFGSKPVNKVKNTALQCAAGRDRTKDRFAWYARSLGRKQIDMPIAGREGPEESLSRHATDQNGSASVKALTEREKGHEESFVTREDLLTRLTWSNLDFDLINYHQTRISK